MTGDDQLLILARRANEAGYGRINPGRNYVYGRVTQPDALGMLYLTLRASAVVNADDGLSADFNITFLLSFAAGNFLYIAASDLIPEVKHDRLLRNNLVHFVTFVSGVSVILLTRAMFHA